jgi:hypothetical protein
MAAIEKLFQAGVRYGSSAVRNSEEESAYWNSAWHRADWLAGGQVFLVASHRKEARQGKPIVQSKKIHF